MQKFKLILPEVEEYLKERHKLIEMLLQNVILMMRSVSGVQLIVNKLKLMKERGHDISHIFDIDEMQNMIEQFKRHCDLAQPVGNRDIENNDIKEFRKAGKIYNKITEVIDQYRDELRKLPEPYDPIIES
jgi:hypothetical protein